MPEWVHIFLSARAEAFRVELGAIVKEQVLAYAKREAHAHRITARRLRSTGMQPELFGDDPEDIVETRSGKK